MNIRQRLLVMFATVVVLAVGVVSWIVSVRARKAFEQVDQQRTAALVTQFRTEFNRQSESVAHDVDRAAKSDRMQHLAYDVLHGGDTAQYVSEAATFAQEYQLDFADLLNADGTIISSAERPAQFGYKLAVPLDNSAATLMPVETRTGAALGIASVRRVDAGEGHIYVVGGREINRAFLQSFVTADGSYVWLYKVQDGAPAAANLIGDAPIDFDKLAPLITAAEASHDVSGAVSLSSERFDTATIQTVTLRDAQSKPAAILLVGTSRRPLLVLQQQIRATAFGVAGVGILFAVLATLWIAARFTKPIEQLAAASGEIAEGNWNTHVEVTSHDEVGQLATAFNSMVQQLTEQRDRLVQVERVAAWRELARRLAHELKNPLFPLQITVENLTKAKRLAPGEFDEIFNESTTTLLAEINNLKAIIGRFSDFSKMPKPQLQRVDLNEAVRRVATLHEPQMKSLIKPVTLRLDLATPAPVSDADPDLLHRVLSNLMLNAIDAMPDGGAVAMRTFEENNRVAIEISDTGTGLTAEERDRLFTPYYTTKSHGTGLGLAVAQSVIADHNGSIAVQSDPGRGTTFTIHLPKTHSSKANA